MALSEIFFIAIGLAMDCFAVAVSSSITQEKSVARKALTMALLFGSFQSAMALAGWTAGLSLRAVIEHFDHWVAVCLLGFVGVKMIYEAARAEGHRMGEAAVSAVVLVGLSFATSIDALAVGLSFSFLGTRIVLPAAIIGLVSFLVTLAGANLGRRLGDVFGRKAEVAGGMILIGIGIKILLEHLR